MYVFQIHKGIWSHCSLYVDVMLIFGINMKGVCETKKYLSSVFKMKDLNEVDTILEIKIKRHSE